jgi:hypothetical protein
MIGNNELRLNEATIAEAVQEYLNKRMGENAPEVQSVKVKDEWFVVWVHKVDLQ